MQILRLSTFLVACAGAGMAIAQDQGDATNETEGMTEEAPATEAAPTGPQQGQTYVKETFTDWQLRCVTLDEVEDPCEVHQTLSDESGTRTAEINIFPLPDTAQVPAGATIVTPLNTLLPEGVSFTIGNAQGKRYPFTFCNQIGCVAQLGLTEAEVNNMKAGSEAHVQIVPMAAPDRTVDLQVSLSGFTAAFDAVSALPQPEDAQQTLTPPAQ
ncbi:invasion associated locus B family protein [Qingshengfaniella alkalisoli]|nr:invasion associated locus B family protein [Qingshengfaniella alkalisoli]